MSGVWPPMTTVATGDGLTLGAANAADGEGTKASLAGFTMAAGLTGTTPAAPGDGWWSTTKAGLAAPVNAVFWPQPQ